MARIVDEGFEGTGYEESWTEAIGTGCTVDQDSAGPGTLPPNGGSQCLQIIAASGQVAYTYRDLTTAPGIAYVRCYIYVDTHNIGTNGNLDHILAFGTSAPGSQNNSLGVKLLTSGTQLQLQPNYHIAAGWQNMTAANISVDTWHCVEVRIDVTNSVVAWRLDGADISSHSSVTLDRGGARYSILGPPYGMTPTATIYYDLFTIDDADWVGIEEEAAPPTRPRFHYHQQEGILAA